MGKCYNCGMELEGNQYRSSECPSCGKDTRICLNCSFYSKDSHWECRESIREAVRDKDRANFCDFFTLADNHENNDTKKDNSIDAFNNLFGD